MPRLTETGEATCPCCMHPLTVEIDQTPPTIAVMLHSKQVCDGDATYLRTKIAELDEAAARMEKQWYASDGDPAKAEGYGIACVSFRVWLRELGLIDGSTPNPKGTNAPNGDAK